MSLAAILARFGPGSPLRLEGVMTHLFAADEADGQVTETNSRASTRRSAASPPRASLPSGSTSATPPRLLAGQARRHRRSRRAPRHEGPAAPRPCALWPGPAIRSAVRRRRTAPRSPPPALHLQPVLAGSRGRRRALGSRRRGGRLQRNLCCHRAHAPGAGAAGYGDGLDRSSATASACWCAASARRSWAASAWISPCSM